MPSFRSVARAAVTAAAMTMCASLARAQQPLIRPLDAPPDAAAFLPRIDFAASAALLNYDDVRFTWDTHWTVDFDVVQFKRFRAGFLGDYQGLLGSEFRPFDPYQSNYTLEVNGSTFVGDTEVGVVFNHISRHLGDRPKRRAVAENSLGIRVMRRFGHERTTFDVRADARKITQHSFVDYTSMSDLDLVLRRKVSPHLGFYGRLNGQLITVDPDVAGRDAQKGGRIEVGTRVYGEQGGLELFVGGERVIDADQLDRTTRQWAFVGFRLSRQ
jgi:hypothetical protein